MSEPNVRLDWRFRILGELARIRLTELKRFYEEARGHFAKDFQRLQEKSHELTGEEWDDYFVDRRDEMESLLDLKQEFGIVALFTLLERFMRLVLMHLHEAGRTAFVPARPRVDDLKAQFAGIGVRITDPPFAWLKIKKL
jgi:hypothetical protein